MIDTRELTVALSMALVLATSTGLAGEPERTLAAAQPTAGSSARTPREGADTAPRLTEPQPGDYEAYVDDEDCG